MSDSKEWLSRSELFGWDKQVLVDKIVLLQEEILTQYKIIDELDTFRDNHLHVLEEISRGLGTTPKGLMKGIWF